MPPKQTSIALTLIPLLLILCATEVKNDFTENKEKWLSFNISDYSFKIHTTGFLPPDSSLIVVKSNAVESVYRYSDSSYAVRTEI